MPRATAQQVILELIRDANGQWIGKKKLFKAFYFAHLYYAEEQPGLLTDWPIARMPEGPGIDSSGKLFGELVQQGFLAVDVVHEGPFPEYRYTLSAKAAAETPLPEDACKAIKEAVNFAAPRSAEELSLITHERSRAWREGKDGDILDIYIDIIPEDEFDREQAKLAALDQTMKEVLGGFAN
jgi:hypothetical protein